MREESRPTDEAVKETICRYLNKHKIGTFEPSFEWKWPGDFEDHNGALCQRDANRSDGKEYSYGDPFDSRDDGHDLLDMLMKHDNSRVMELFAAFLQVHFDAEWVLYRDKKWGAVDVMRLKPEEITLGIYYVVTELEKKNG